METLGQIEEHYRRAMLGRRWSRAQMWLERAAALAAAAGRTDHLCHYLRSLATLRLIRGDALGAVLAIEEAVRTAPGDARHRVCLARVLFDHLGDGERAAGVLLHVLRRMRGVERCVRQEAYSTLGRIRLSQGSAQAALACLRRSARFRSASNDLALAEEMLERGVYVEECRAILAALQG